jgi:hypothetical protein
MIVARNFTELTEDEFRALLYCAQYTIEQLTGRAVYRDGVVPKPSAGVLGKALKALEAAKRENGR